MTTPECCVYRRVGELDLCIDLYPAPGGGRRPLVVWIHGGALILGSRTRVPAHLLEACHRENWALASLDYRLAPEVKLPTLLDDVAAAFEWLRGEGARAYAYDPDQLAVTGGSAGGYLTLWCGTSVVPRPRCLVSYWGYGDLLGDWYTQPSDHYRRVIPLISREEAESGVGREVVSGVEGGSERNRARGRYYHYLRQNGLWTRAVTGWDPGTEREAIAAYCPVRVLPADFPPTFLIHGTEDTDVPHSCSIEMAEALRVRGIDHVLISVEGAEHGLAGADASVTQSVYAQAVAFLRAHLP